jgi:hypothetical protein
LGVFALIVELGCARGGSIFGYTFMLLAAAIGAGGIYVPGNWQRLVILIVRFLVYGLKSPRAPAVSARSEVRPRSRRTGRWIGGGTVLRATDFVSIFVLKRLGIVPSGPWIARGLWPVEF